MRARRGGQSEDPDLRAAVGQPAVPGARLGARQEPRARRVPGLRRRGEGGAPRQAGRAGGDRGPRGRRGERASPARRGDAVRRRLHPLQDGAARRLYAVPLGLERRARRRGTAAGVRHPDAAARPPSALRPDRRLAHAQPQQGGAQGDRRGRVRPRPDRRRPEPCNAGAGRFPRPGGGDSRRSPQPAGGPPEGAGRAHGAPRMEAAPAGRPRPSAEGPRRGAHRRD